jgi:hypothetical protein
MRYVFLSSWRCLPFSRLRDPARHWLGCVTCETGNVVFKHFVRDESDVECRFTCSEGYTEKRNADGLDGDCVPSLLQDSAAYFAHTLNVTNVRRVARSYSASDDTSGGALEEPEMTGAPHLFRPGVAPQTR